MGVTAGHAGSRVRVQGKSLKRVDSVVFQGAPGGADDVSVAPLRARKKLRRRARAAHGGHRPGRSSSPPTAPSRAPTAVPLTIDPTPGRRRAATADGLGIDVEVQGNRVFYGAERQAQVSYVVRDSQPAHGRGRARPPLRRRRDHALGARRGRRRARRRRSPGTAPPAARSSATAATPSASSPPRASGATASSAQAPAPGTPAKAVPGSFLFQRHIFPIRGAHTMGTGAAAFGGGRGHQGQDIFAKCGTPLVAARGGRVKFKQYHSAAGHYIVIDGDDTGYDYAYMHLRDASLVDQGDHVYTGQPIGFVGDTGRAHGCHLHFEVWKAPGWYSGGAAGRPAAVADGLGQGFVGGLGVRG